MKDHAVIILRDGEKVLFVQRAATKKSLPNIWAFPSGTMEEGETAEVTVAREAKEELRVDVGIENFFSTVELSELGARLHFVACKQIGLDPIIFDPVEIQQTQWLTFDEFFNTYTDDQIGHGLIYLRRNPEIWKSFFK